MARPNKTRITVTKTCEQCAEEFQPRPGRAHKIRFCKWECFQASRYTTKTCPRCGVEFKARRSQAWRKYCNQKCTRTHVEKTCERCSRPFKAYKYNAEKRRFCSIPCERKPRIITICPLCRAPVGLLPSRKKRFDFCSNKCRRESTRLSKARQRRFAFRPPAVSTEHKQKVLTDWRKHNKVRIANYTARAKMRDPEGFAAKKREDGKRYRKLYPEKLRAVGHRMRAQRMKAEGSWSQSEWLDLCAMYEHRCLGCGLQKPLTADHVIPLIRGGTNYIENIQPLCKSCNSRKHTKIIDYRPSWPAIW